MGSWHGCVTPVFNNCSLTVSCVTFKFRSTQHAHAHVWVGAEHSRAAHFFLGCCFGVSQVSSFGTPVDAVDQLVDGTVLCSVASKMFVGDHARLPRCDSPLP